MLKRYDEASVFTPENLLREARRQKGVLRGEVPQICILDPDGDIVEYLGREGRLRRCESWACYHTTLHEFAEHDRTLGIVGCVVGASFAVLVAEQLFASGCDLLVSVTSAGMIGQRDSASPFMLITSALRDEGTSVHYLPRSPSVALHPDLVSVLMPPLSRIGITAGMSWTTDAPFRETPSSIDEACRLGARAVEMEAAALYAFAEARGKRVVCLAHLTNTMAQSEGDFEKGEANGSTAALNAIGVVAATLSTAGTT